MSNQANNHKNGRINLIFPNSCFGLKNKRKNVTEKPLKTTDHKELQSFSSWKIVSCVYVFNTKSKAIFVKDPCLGGFDVLSRRDISLGEFSEMRKKNDLKLNIGNSYVRLEDLIGFKVISDYNLKTKKKNYKTVENFRLYYFIIKKVYSFSVDLKGYEYLYEAIWRSPEQFD